MVQSKGKKSSVNFKYYALENWLLSLTSKRLSSTAGHFPTKASLASFGLYGMRCKLCRRGRQEGRVVPLLYFILYYCCPVNFKTQKIGSSNIWSNAATTERPLSLEFGLPSRSWIPPPPTSATSAPLQPPTRAHYARVRRFSLFAFTSSPYDGKNL